MKLFLSFLIFFSLIQLHAKAADFNSASSVEQTREQIAKLPKDDIWWSVYGKDMAWNFKNLHRMYPTANVYREGTASELDYALSDEIANFQVNTPSGKKSYREFLYSDDSTTMGMVILVLSI